MLCILYAMIHVIWLWTSLYLWSLRNIRSHEECLRRNWWNYNLIDLDQRNWNLYTMCTDMYDTTRHGIDTVTQTRHWFGGSSLYVQLIFWKLLVPSSYFWCFYVYPLFIIAYCFITTVMCFPISVCLKTFSFHILKHGLRFQ